MDLIRFVWNWISTLLFENKISWYLFALHSNFDSNNFQFCIQLWQFMWYSVLMRFCYIPFASFLLVRCTTLECVNVVRRKWLLRNYLANKCFLLISMPSSLTWRLIIATSLSLCGMIWWDLQNFQFSKVTRMSEWKHSGVSMVLGTILPQSGVRLLKFWKLRDVHCILFDPQLPSFIKILWGQNSSNPFTDFFFLRLRYESISSPYEKIAGQTWPYKLGWWPVWEKENYRWLF